MSRESIRAARTTMQNQLFRSSTSRSYYAAYAAVTQVLADKGFEFTGDRLGPSHHKVREIIQMNIGQLKPKGHRRMRAADKKRLSSAMNLLYDNRLNADLQARSYG